MARSQCLLVYPSMPSQFFLKKDGQWCLDYLLPVHSVSLKLLLFVTHTLPPSGHPTAISLWCLSCFGRWDTLFVCV